MTKEKKVCIYRVCNTHLLFCHFWSFHLLLWIQFTISWHFLLQTAFSRKHHLSAIIVKYITFSYVTGPTLCYIHIISYDYFINQLRKQKEIYMYMIFYQYMITFNSTLFLCEFELTLGDSFRKKFSQCLLGKVFFSPFFFYS